MKIDEALYQLKQNIKMHEIEGTTSNQNEREKALLDYITNLQEEKDKFKLRCYKALKLIRNNYGLLDKYGIDMIDDILNGGDDNENK